MNRLASLLTRSETKLLKQAPLMWAPPMLATLCNKPFSKKDWLYEYKFDGIRALVYQQGQKVKIFSRNQLDIGENYPELLEAFKTFHVENFIVDGEIVAFKEKVPSFSALQQRMHIRTAGYRTQNIPVCFYAFDFIYFENYFLEKLPLVRRKELLKSIFTFHSSILYSEHWAGGGVALFKKACSAGWEGIMAKYAYSTYVHQRSKAWLKFKCIQKQEFVIGGFSEPKGTRRGFGALLLGYYQGNQLIFAGKVGTGFTQPLLDQLYSRLSSLAISQSPFIHPIPMKGVTWVKPLLVAEIRFSEWTEEGKLRHPSFEGLRIDKLPEEVVKEQATVSHEV